MSKPNRSGKVHDKKGYGGEFYSGERVVKKGGIVHFDSFAFQHYRLIEWVGKKVMVRTNAVHERVRNRAITVYPHGEFDHINSICDIAVEYELNDLKGKPPRFRWSKNINPQ